VQKLNWNRKRLLLYFVVGVVWVAVYHVAYYHVFHIERVRLAVDTVWSVVMTSGLLIIAALFGRRSKPKQP
jgi:steroid 5-alpha reductase family enzyme